MKTNAIELSLPDWVPEFLAGRPDQFKTVEDRVGLAIELSRENVLRKTGGPFGAAVFERESGRLISVGINQVVTLNCSVAHAELMAIMGAQQKLKNFDLGAKGLPAHDLATSGQMCAMCFGAMAWSGVTRVGIGARATDTESLTGFDEGPIHPDWKVQLEKRGIEVVQDVLRDEACAVLRMYREQGGVIYNGRGGK